jgi:hypothetical protein
MMGLMMLLFLSAQVIEVAQLNVVQLFWMIDNGFDWTQHQTNGNDNHNHNNNNYVDDDSYQDEEEEDGRDDEDFTTDLFSHSTTTRIQINSPIFERQNIIMRRPTEDNTVIAFIAMGPHHTFLVHRAIRSIRASGEFHGYIMIMTDHPGWDYFSWSLDQSDSKVILIRGHDRHLMATHAAPPSSSSSLNHNGNSSRTNTTTQGRPFKHYVMTYKRFKTYLLEYIAEHDILNRQIEYCLYLDIDNVIFHPIQRLLNDYFYQFTTTYQQVIEKDTNRLMSHYHRYDDVENNETMTSAIEYIYPKRRLQFVSMWKDIRPAAKLWQAGQILYHRHYSQGCMDHWRAQIDSEDNYGEYMEQPLFVKALQHQYHDLLTAVPPLPPHQNKNNDRHHHQDMYQNNGKDTPSKTLCHVVELPDQPRHFNMARKDIVSGQLLDIPTILHFSAARVNQNSAQEQRNSFVQALQLRYQTVRLNRTATTKVAVRKEDGSKHLLSRNNTLISWDTIITPMSTYGRGKSNR